MTAQAIRENQRKERQILQHIDWLSERNSKQPNVIQKLVFIWQEELRKLNNN